MDQTAEKLIEEPTQAETIFATANSKQTIDLYYNYLKWYVQHKVIDAPKEIVKVPIIEKLPVVDKVEAYGRGKSRFISREIKEEPKDDQIMKEVKEEDFEATFVDLKSDYREGKTTKPRTI